MASQFQAEITLMPYVVPSKYANAKLAPKRMLSNVTLTRKAIIGAKLSTNETEKHDAALQRHRLPTRSLVRASEPPGRVGRRSA